MKRLLLVILLCLPLVGCSDEAEIGEDILSSAAEFNLQQAFDLKEKQSVTMFVEVYENGQFMGDREIYFGNNFEGNGKVQFSMFRAENSAELFLVGAIQDKNHAVSKKMFVETSEWGVIFKAAENDVITKKGQYRIGMYGSLSEEDSTTYTEPLNLSVEEKKEFIEAYERYPVVNVVVVEVN
ncbi:MULTISPECIES: hypothetical protein [unclassified Solibacillus]|uniref:hypothetical protein n=1 Tax=unclassified Solibacillus TaxID=2637870 RepID=UPI0030FCFC52